MELFRVFLWPSVCVQCGQPLSRQSGFCCPVGDSPVLDVINRQPPRLIRVVGCRRSATLNAVSDVTRILEAAQQGDPTAADELLPLVYEELRRLAAHKMANEAAGQTLQATALVHEAWLRLTGNQNQKWDGRAHFFAAAAEAMRRILIDRARRKRAARHGGNRQRVNIEEVDVACATSDDELLAL